ncbi:MAG: hypothetical protein KGI06_03830 [Candidatus Micrarchaeota archaeon]|nr:hypothetical protein [Candidatus Micrarchaeota archaeon]
MSNNLDDEEETEETEESEDDEEEDDSKEGFSLFKRKEKTSLKELCNRCNVRVVRDSKSKKLRLVKKNPTGESLDGSCKKEVIWATNKQFKNENQLKSFLEHKAR